MAGKAKDAANQPDSGAELTVEQLAYETGMSVRNIRNHQSRGLLPPPEVRSRVGYYGPAHVARLRLIQEMQGEGFKLSAISRLIGEHGEDADRFVGLRQAVTAWRRPTKRSASAPCSPIRREIALSLKPSACISWIRRRRATWSGP